jgi:hypothetical protein
MKRSALLRPSVVIKQLDYEALRRLDNLRYIAIISGHSLSPVVLVSSGIGIYDRGSEQSTQIITGGSL